MIDYSIDLTNDVDKDRLDRMVASKIDYFERNKESVKFWETPLQPNSLLKMVDEILKKNNLEMVFEDINSTKQSKNTYNCNLSTSFGDKDKIYGMTIRIKNVKNSDEFKSNFVDNIFMIAPSSKRFKNITVRDILLYDIEEKKGGYLNLKLVILQIKSEKDYDDFIRDFKYPLEAKYGSLVTTFKKFSPIFYLEAGMLDTPDVSFLEKKKEKLVRMKGEAWSYYLPADWLRYPLSESLIPASVRSSWLTVYHPLGGFDFSSYGNINVCDDMGPNRLNIELAKMPLDQGVFVTPRVNFMMGLNQHKINHLHPYSVKFGNDSEYYYAIAFECYVDQRRLRIPSVFKRKPSSSRKREIPREKYLWRLLLGEHSPEPVLESHLAKEIHYVLSCLTQGRIPQLRPDRQEKPQAKDLLHCQRV